MKDFGLRESIIEFAEYVLGGSKVPYIPYQEDGNWEKYLPKYENQTTKQGQETSACTAYGSLSQLETLHNRLYGEEPNYSERFTYLLVPITPGKGTDPQKTYETIRSRGVVDEKYLPMTDSLEEYLDSSDITGSLLAKGQNWLVKHDFKHEWLWTTRPANYLDVLKDALKTSPLGVSVSAWNKEGDVYVSYGDVNNHFCLLYKFDDEGYPWIFDTYDHSRKKLSKDHNIRRAKRIWLNRKVVKALKQHKSILEIIVERLLMKKTLLQLCEEAIGTDVTPDDLVPDTVACAITVSTLINKTDATFPKVAGTWTLWDIFEHRTDYVKVTEPTPGTIIICPTTPGHPFPGHTGIFMPDRTIASNDSKTGKFIKNYDMATWRARYADVGGYQIYMFKKK